jgi:hypothetical protein
VRTIRAGEREARAIPQIVGDQLHAFRRQLARLHERDQRIEDAVAKPGFVRAAGARRDQVHMAVGEDVAVGDPADRPRCALARLDLGEIRGRLLVEMALAGKERRHELASLQHEIEVLRHAALVFPAPVLLALDAQHRREARQQVGLRAHRCSSSASGMFGESKYFGSGHRRTTVPVRRASFDFSDFSFCFSSPPSNAIVCFCPSR